MGDGVGLVEGSLLMYFLFMLGGGSGSGRGGVYTCSVLCVVA